MTDATLAVMRELGKTEPTEDMETLLLAAKDVVANKDQIVGLLELRISQANIVLKKVIGLMQSQISEDTALLAILGATPKSGKGRPPGSPDRAPRKRKTQEVTA